MAINKEPVGLLKIAIIDGIDYDTNQLKVRFTGSENITTWGQSEPTPVSIPYPLSYTDGTFIGSNPSIGSRIIVGQAINNSYYFVSFFDRDTSSPRPAEGELLIHSSDDTKIRLNNLDETLKIGSENYNINISNKTSNLIISNFKNSYFFTEAARKTSGTIKRDIDANSKTDDSLKLTYESYENDLDEIGLDPKASVNINKSDLRNPPLVEDRKLIYEFASSANVLDDLNESQFYSKSKLNNNTTSKYKNRRLAKTDTLSLSLSSPNYLIETISGTVVDIFGNILDLNRQPIPIGSDNLTIRSLDSSQKDKTKSFNEIKSLHRKSIAFHFELNAKKDLTGNNGKISLPDIKSKDDYARNRSRFFLDIDKEGQFKLNIPASSESGNIPLLSRYENYSSFSEEEPENPNKLIKNDDGKDIYIDGFAADAIRKNAIFGGAAGKNIGTIKITDGDRPATPLDRIDEVHINHGTAYHDITDTCWLHQDGNEAYFDYQVAGQETINFSSITKLPTPVETEIFVSGPKKNAGGRSGQINMDGSLELNVGANSSDRQSLWLDFAGGIVGNIGKDLRQNSAVIGMDGNLILQIGNSSGITSDSRFKKQSNDVQGGIIDIRVFRSGGFAHLIRIDDNGVSVMTGGQVRMFSKGNMVLKSDSNVIIEGEKVIIQEREVLKNITGGSI